MNNDEKKCPYCAEVIKAEAVKCKHCGTNLNAPPSLQESERDSSEQPVSGRDYHPGTVSVGAFILIVALPLLFFTNPDEQDFRDFVSSKISSMGKVQEVPLDNKAISTIASLAVEKITRRDNYLLFSTFEIDTTVLQLFSVNVPRLKFVGVFGQIIPLEDYTGLLATRGRRGLSNTVEPPEGIGGQIADAIKISNAIVDSLKAVAPWKAAVAEFYANKGSFPATCDEVGAECPSHVSLASGGNIVIDLGSTGVTALAGTTARLSPRENANGDIWWTCSSNAPSSYVPSGCVTEIDATPAARMAEDAATSAVASASPSDQSQRILPDTPEGTDKSTSSVVVFSAINGGGLPVARCNSSEVITALRRYIAEAIHAEPGRRSGGKWWDLADVNTTSDLGGRQECAASIEMGYADKTLDSIPMTYATRYEDARLTVQVISWELQPLMEPGGAAVSGSCENGASNMAEVYACEIAKTEATVDGAEMELRAALSRGGFSEQMIAMRRSQEVWESARDSDCQQDYDEAEKQVGGYAESNRLECIQAHNEGRIEELRAYAEVCSNGDRSACVVE